MRTLVTQMRLKRLIREEVEFRRRLAESSPDPLLAAVAVARLRDLMDSFERSWGTEAASGGSLPLVAGHVRREMERLRRLIPGVGEARHPFGEGDRFQEAAVPLLFLLRGLDQAGDEVLAGWWDQRPRLRDRQTA